MVSAVHGRGLRTIFKMFRKAHTHRGPWGTVQEQVSAASRAFSGLRSFCIHDFTAVSSQLPSTCASGASGPVRSISPPQHAEAVRRHIDCDISGPRGIHMRTELSRLMPRWLQPSHHFNVRGWGYDARQQQGIRIKPHVLLRRHLSM